MSLITMPSTPAPQTVDWIQNDIVAAVISPFTGQQQTQDWQSGFLEASISMPPMQRADAQAWFAFISECRGMANTFMFGDPLAVIPLGRGGSPTVSGANQSGFSLNTAGWTLGTTPALRAGDWLQIGSRLYQNLADINPISGTATLKIWPQLRESPADGAPIILNNTQGTFRLKSNVRKVSVTVMRFYGLQFDIREAF